MIYIGIDPGKNGGIAAIENGVVKVASLSEHTLLEMKNFPAMFGHKDDKRMLCCLEQVHAMPKQGVTSTFSFGENFGYIKGVLEAYGIPYQEIPPQRWKKEFGLNSDKKRSIEVCKRLFPYVDLKPPLGRVDHDGMAEALLMAEYARRKL